VDHMKVNCDEFLAYVSTENSDTSNTANSAISNKRIRWAITPLPARRPRTIRTIRLADVATGQERSDY
jgi:hypothetical protein